MTLTRLDIFIILILVINNLISYCNTTIIIIETKEKSVPRDNSMSDSEENSVIKDLDQQSVGDTDNQVIIIICSIFMANQQIYP